MTPTETKGKVTFASQRDAVFRFLVSPRRICLEHQTTKRQWECTVSSANDFALKGAGIPHEIVMDYLAKSLSQVSEGGAVSNCEVDLIDMSDDLKRLDFSLQFAISGVVWQPQYQFVLQSLNVTETQVLEAKLVDAEESLDRLQMIVPAWVVESDKVVLHRNEAALQAVTLAGIQSWLFCCKLAKKVLEQSGESVDTVVDWSCSTYCETSRVVVKYWWIVWECGKEAGGVGLKLLEDAITQH